MKNKSNDQKSSFNYKKAIIWLVLVILAFAVEESIKETVWFKQTKYMINILLDNIGEIVLAIASIWLVLTWNRKKNKNTQQKISQIVSTLEEHKATTDKLTKTKVSENVFNDELNKIQNEIGETANKISKFLKEIDQKVNDANVTLKESFEAISLDFEKDIYDHALRIQLNSEMIEKMLKQLKLDYSHIGNLNKGEKRYIGYTEEQLKKQNNLEMPLTKRTPRGLKNETWVLLRDEYNQNNNIIE